jgi:hypothetical protein
LIGARAGLPAALDSSRAAKGGIVGATLLALLLVPAPLLPPHRLAEGLQSALGLEWAEAYLLTALGLHAVFYAALGLLASFSVNRTPGVPMRILQAVLVPLAVMGVAMLIRSMKLGSFPLLPNMVVPIAACAIGAGCGLVARYRAWMAVMPIAVVVVALALWGLRGTTTGELSVRTEAHLRRLVAAGPGLGSGDARFAALMQAAFAPGPRTAEPGGEARHNRAAILALGIALGHERIARYVGLDPQGELVRAAVSLREGVTLRGREDWPRHYTLSAALAVLGGPFTSDAAGLLKEQLDALTHGSGFSFTDMAADRAGTRFAAVATQSDAAARSLHARLLGGFQVDEFLPPIGDLPENLSVEQFRSIYDTVGSPSFLKVVAEIEGRLDRCAGLSVR